MRKGHLTLIRPHWRWLLTASTCQVVTIKPNYVPCLKSAASFVLKIGYTTKIYKMGSFEVVNGSLMVIGNGQFDTSHLTFY